MKWLDGAVVAAVTVFPLVVFPGIDRPFSTPKIFLFRSASHCRGTHCRRHGSASVADTAVGISYLLDGMVLCADRFSPVGRICLSQSIVDLTVAGRMVPSANGSWDSARSHCFGGGAFRYGRGGSGPAAIRRHRPFRGFWTGGACSGRPAHARICNAWKSRFRCRLPRFLFAAVPGSWKDHGPPGFFVIF